MVKDHRLFRIDTTDWIPDPEDELNVVEQTQTEYKVKECIVLQIPEIVYKKKVDNKTKEFITEKKVAYYFKDDNKKICVYANTNINSGLFENEEKLSVREKESSINDDAWCIKLNIKYDSDTGVPYIYVNFIRTLPNCAINLEEIFSIIVHIAGQFDITNLRLMDDADFMCDGRKLKAFYLRALDSEVDIRNLSIYNRFGFQSFPDKRGHIYNCIKILRTISCKRIVEISKTIIDIISKIREKESKLDIYKCNVNKKTFEITFENISESRYSGICSSFVSNLRSVVNIFPHDSIDIYTFYKSKAKKGEQDCPLMSQILESLKRSDNSNVIVVDGLIITNLFTMMYSIFEKIKYVYMEMKAEISDVNYVLSTGSIRLGDIEDPLECGSEPEHLESVLRLKYQ